MSSNESEVYKLESDVRELGLRIADDLPFKLDNSQREHLRELFSSNEHGEGVRFLRWLMAHSGVTLASDNLARLDQIENLQAEIRLAYELRKLEGED